MTPWFQILVTKISFQKLLISTMKIKILYQPELYRLDKINGKIFGNYEGSLGKNNYKAEFNYYPILNSPYIPNSPWQDQTTNPNAGIVLDTETFNGIQIEFQNDWQINDIVLDSYWSTTNDQQPWEKNSPDDTYFHSFSNTNLFANDSRSTKFANDYILVFNDSIGFGKSYDLRQFNFAR